MKAKKPEKDKNLDARLREKQSVIRESGSNSEMKLEESDRKIC